jgi:uncharacterized membrane protein YoaT (DUF817 family)
MAVGLCGGFMFAALASIVDWGIQQMGLYEFRYLIIPFLGSSLFYIWGPVFTMGALFFQFLQPNRLLQVVNILVFSVAYLSMESLIVKSGAASYHNWHLLASFGIDLLTFFSFSYIGGLVINAIEQKKAY